VRMINLRSPLGGSPRRVLYMLFYSDSGVAMDGAAMLIAFLASGTPPRPP
jgi:hypothetical protein